MSVMITDVVSVKTAANLVGLTTHSIRKKIWSGELPTIKLGSHITLVNPDDVRAIWPDRPRSNTKDN